MTNFSKAQEIDLFSLDHFPTAPVERGVFVDKNGNTQATAGALSFGISRDAVSAADIAAKKKFDGSSGADLPVGKLGVFALVIGGDVNPGDELTPQVTTGYGVVAVATNWVGAFAIDGGHANDVIRAERIALYKK